MVPINSSTTSTLSSKETDIVAAIKMLKSFNLITTVEENKIDERFKKNKKHEHDDDDMILKASSKHKGYSTSIGALTSSPRQSVTKTMFNHNNTAADESSDPNRLEMRKGSLF